MKTLYQSSSVLEAHMLQEFLKDGKLDTRYRCSALGEVNASEKP